MRCVVAIDKRILDMLVLLASRLGRNRSRMCPTEPTFRARDLSNRHRAARHLLMSKQTQIQHCQHPATRIHRRRAILSVCTLYCRTEMDSICVIDCRGKLLNDLAFLFASIMYSHSLIMWVLALRSCKCGVVHVCMCVYVGRSSVFHSCANLKQYKSSLNQIYHNM